MIWSAGYQVKEQELEEALANKGEYLKYVNLENQVNPLIGITGLA